MFSLRVLSIAFSGFIAVAASAMSSTDTVKIIDYTRYQREDFSANKAFEPQDGQGFDSQTGEFKATNCLKGKMVPPKSAALSGTLVADRFVVTSSDQLYSTTQMSIAAALGFGFFKMDGSYASFNALWEKSNKVRGRFVAKYIGSSSSFEFEDPSRGLSEAAEKVLKERGPQGLRALCGDSYVSGRIRGASYFGEIEIFAKDSTEVSQLSKDLNMAFDDGYSKDKLTATFSRFFSHKASVDSFSFFQVLNGDAPSIKGATEDKCVTGAPTRTPNSIEEIDNYIATLSCRAQSDPRTLSIEIKKYPDAISDIVDFGGPNEFGVISIIRQLSERRAGLEDVRMDEKRADNDKKYGSFLRCRLDNELYGINRALTKIKSIYRDAVAASQQATVGKGELARDAEAVRKIWDDLELNVEKEVGAIYPEWKDRGPQKVPPAPAARTMIRQSCFTKQLANGQNGFFADDRTMAIEMYGFYAIGTAGQKMGIYECESNFHWSPYCTHMLCPRFPNGSGECLGGSATKLHFTPQPSGSTSRSETVVSIARVEDKGPHIIPQDSVVSIDFVGCSDQFRWASLDKEKDPRLVGGFLIYEAIHPDILDPRFRRASGKRSCEF